MLQLLVATATNSSECQTAPDRVFCALEVGEAGFEGKGQRFPFRQADGREFCWEDGTVQRVEKIQKMLFQVR